MKRWKTIEWVTIDSLWYWWVGIATISEGPAAGKKLIVKWGLPWSVVDVRVVKKKKDYLEWHITNVVSFPEELLDGEARCPHYLYAYAQRSEMPIHKQWCGWCKRQAISYPQQLAMKQTMVTELFEDCFASQWTTQHPIVGSPKVYQYRNKIEFSFWKYLVRDREQWGFSEAHHRSMWFHKQWEFSKVVNINQCFLVSEKMHTVYDRIKADCKASWLPVHDSKTHHGVLRHCVIREWVRTWQLLVNIAIHDENLAANTQWQSTWNSLIASWSADSEMTELVTTLVVTSNSWLADIVHGSNSTLEVQWWTWTIIEWLQLTEEWITARFQVSPFSFFQTNTWWAEELFGKAAELVWTKKWSLIDLYCGSGSIWLTFHALWIWSKLIWIDIVESAIRDAHHNALMNWMNAYVEFYAWKAEQLLSEWAVWDEWFQWDDLIVIDPPRSWIHKAVVEFLRSVKQRHSDVTLLYISCNPVTMRRDVDLLVAWWVFSLTAHQAVDMFPHTHHIECIGLLR